MAKQQVLITLSDNGIDGANMQVSLNVSFSPNILNNEQFNSLPPNKKTLWYAANDIAKRIIGQVAEPKSIVPN